MKSAAEAGYLVSRELSLARKHERDCGFIAKFGCEISLREAVLVEQKLQNFIRGSIGESGNAGFVLIDQQREQRNCLLVIPRSFRVAGQIEKRLGIDGQLLIESANCKASRTPFFELIEI